MARSTINRFGEMEMFVRVVDLGGLSAAARAAQMTPSAISKLIARMETRLGARLLTRSTRQLQLTAEGQVFYTRSKHLLERLDDAEGAVGSAEQVIGRIRLSASSSYVFHVLAPILSDFVASHPGVSIDIEQTDTVVDLLADRTDVAVRAGPLSASSLTARKLGETALLIVASPAYLDRMGVPHSLSDLENHDRLGFSYARASNGWRFVEDARSVTVNPAVRVRCSDGEGMRHLALAGVGVARLASFAVRDDLAERRLVALLSDSDTGTSEAVQAVYVGQDGLVPARVRALLDFLAQRGRVS